MIALDQIPTWRQVRQYFDHPIMAKLEDIVGSSNKTAGAKRFFGWVASSDAEEARWMRQFIRNNERNASDPTAAGSVRAAMLRWIESFREINSMKSGSVRSLRDSALRAMDKVREVDPESFPRIDPRSMPMGSHHDAGNYIALGNLEWLEFADVEPERRDAVALSLMRNSALEVFDRYENIFEFGQRLLRGDVTDVKHGRSAKVLQRLIADEVRSWQKRGRSQFGTTWSKSLSNRINRLKDPKVWRSFGIEPLFEASPLASTVVADLVIACVGPTYRLNQAVQIVFCTDTGWNRQPIQELPRQPYAFRTKSALVLGSHRVLMNFKNRADHMVHANTNMSTIVRGIAELDLKSHWDEVASELKLEKADEQVTLGMDSELAILLDRLEKIQGPSRNWTRGETENLFFYVLSQRASSAIKAKREPGILMPQGPLTRKGATFSAMRKSFLNTLSTAGFEPTFVAELAGHRSRSILAKNYFVDQQAARTFEASVRVFQECIQELVLNERIGLRLNISGETRAHFRMIALHTGVLSACGMTSAELDGDISEDFIFDPTHSNLTDLYLCHRGLKQQRYEVSHQRWMVQGNALMAVIKSIGRTLFKQGVGRDYWVAARTTNDLLKSGKITLPKMLDL